jgi:AcrR family transcriptional regulator
LTNENKEEKILDCAIKIFSEKGFSATTTSEIAREAGVAEGTVFRYFKTKKDILRKVMIKLIEIMGSRLITDRAEAILAEYADADEKEILSRLIMDRIDLINEHWDIIKVIFVEIQYHNDIREAFIQNVIVRGKEILEKYFKRGMARKIFKDMDPAVAGRTLVGMAAVMVLQHRAIPGLVNADFSSQVDMILDIFLHGMMLNQKA